MLLNRPYYLLKPYIPWQLRIGLRRLLANNQRKRSSEVWPINETAGTRPAAWPGWPEGKQFAFVLTHDVERMRGLRRIEQLMDLELKHGFRSCFNFVPEEEYTVTDSLRRTLEGKGFEAGVHGLEHDGKLYNSRKRFVSKAARIRQYLQAWNAGGFRSPLMQHRLTWLHKIGMDYDGSTFDTDPFEPESDCVGTIFPFWVPGPGDSGFVELPYTLPQDFTLFVILRETNIDIWKRKLDWIASKGGMALINTHPDYMCFGNDKKQRDEFPVSLYEEFLTYAKERYGDVSWSALPRDVNRFYRSALPPSSRNTRKKVCMVAHAVYETDNRVRRYAEALAARGDQVDVIALCRSRSEIGEKDIRGVRVVCIQHRQHNERSKWTYARRVLSFLFVSSAVLTGRHYRQKYDLIHVHNLPDFLVFSAFYPKWTGAKVILDVHDIVPELFASKFGTSPAGYFDRTLKFAERKSFAFADHVIVSNHLWCERLNSRSGIADKSSVFINNVDNAVFYRRARTRNDGQIVILFPGSFQWHQGLDIAIKAFARLKDVIPNSWFHLYGGGGGRDAEAGLSLLASELGVGERVKFFGSISLDQIPEVIANADLGVVPKRADGFGNEAYSTKIMEFMSQGLPVVASRTKIDAFYFDDTIVRFFSPGDDKAMADAMLDVIENKTLRDDLIRNGYAYADRHGWDSRKQEYFDLVDMLTTEQFSDSGLLHNPCNVAAAKLR